MKLRSIQSRVSDWPITAHRMRKKTFSNRTRSISERWISCVNTCASVYTRSLRCVKVFICCDTVAVVVVDMICYFYITWESTLATAAIFSVTITEAKSSIVMLLLRSCTVYTYHCVTYSRTATSHQTTLTKHTTLWYAVRVRTSTSFTAHTQYS